LVKEKSMIAQKIKWMNLEIDDSEILVIRISFRVNTNSDD